MPPPGAEGAGQRTNTQGLPDPPCRLCPVLGTAGATRAAETRRLPCEQLPLQLELPKFLPASIHTQHVPQLPGVRGRTLEDKVVGGGMSSACVCVCVCVCTSTHIP